MNIVFAYEHLSEPFDEGVKKFAKMLHDALAAEHNIQVVRNPPSPGPLTKMLLVPRILVASLRCEATAVVFIPEGSVTFFGLLKIWLLKHLLGKKLRAIGTQRRVLAGWQQRIIRRLDLGRIYAVSGSMADDLKSLGIRAHVINAGVEVGEFSPACGIDLGALRRKHGLTDGSQILLHVGHIKESRNLRWLIDISRVVQGIQVVIVGSTATTADAALLSELRKAEIVVKDGFVAEIQELYQVAAWYLFPVLEHTGAMEVPLSVLEAMAVGVPVMTTRFGRLPELFPEDEGFRYVSSSQDVIHLLQGGFGGGNRNREKVQQLSWQSAATSLLEPLTE